MAWKPKKYVVLEDRVLYDEVMAYRGEFVYDQSGYDYGLSRDDTEVTGVEHITVTKNEDGSYPGFTIPRRHLAVAPE